MVRVPWTIAGAAVLIAAGACWWRGRRAAPAGPPSPAWRGLELSGPSLVRWREAMVPGDGRIGAKGAATVRVAIRYSLDRDGLGSPAERATSIPPGLVIRIRFPGGEETAHTPESLRRARFFADTGLHPSWATPPLVEVPAEMTGSIETDIGPVLLRPEAPMAIEVTAQAGRWASNPLAIRVEP